MEKYVRPEFGVITLEAAKDILWNSNETEQDVFGDATSV